METLLTCNIIRRQVKVIYMVLGFIMGLPLAYVLINLINAGTHHRLFLPKLGVAVFLLIIAGIAAIVIVHLTMTGKLIIRKIGQGQYEFEIDDKGEVQIDAKGTWTCEGYYTREYARYGMYLKNLVLVLYCDGKPFCILRHQLGGAASDPEGFAHVESFYVPPVPEVFCKRTYWVFSLLRKGESTVTL